MLTILLAPYDDIGAFSGRVRVSVPRMSVGEVGATALAMIVHELATNSMKYGALSAATGTLDVSSIVMRMHKCESACKIGSDSNSMILHGGVVLFSRGISTMANNLRLSSLIRPD